MNYEVILETHRCLAVSENVLTVQLNMQLYVIQRIIIIIY